MKRITLFFGILMVILSLNSCIVANAPGTKEVIKVPVGEEVKFKVSTIGGITVWKLNDSKVDLGNTYYFKAKEVGEYKLTAFNKVRLTWTIEVYKITTPFYEDADGDGYGDPDSVIEELEKPDGYVTNADDCNDSDAEISPDAAKICADGEGSYCNDGEVVSCPSADVPLVSASDVDSGLTNVKVTWTAVKDATHYNVYMAEEAEDDYEKIASEVTGTSYEYVENWLDIVNLDRDLPRLAPGASIEERKTFTVKLLAYRKTIEPLMHSFKKEKRFKVQACKGSECADLSEYDAGQAEFIHTEAFSDVSQMLIGFVGYPLLLCLADAPPGMLALGWPGLEVPGAFGGMVKGYIDKTAGVYVRLQYKDYADGILPSRVVNINGEIGGNQDLGEAAIGIIRVKGPVKVTGAITADVQFKSFISAGGSTPNSGTIWVTYKGVKYSFPLPL